MISKELADKIFEQAYGEMVDWVRFKQPRMAKIKLNEDLYANKEKPLVPGLFSIPLPIMGGFVDSLVSELNQPVKISFSKQEMGDLKKARWATGVWEKDSGPTEAAWDIKDIRGKKLAAFSGRAIYNIFAESDPIYKHYLRNVHHYNFYIDPRGGADVEEAQGLGELNVFKSEFDLKAGVMSKLYNQEQVNKMLNSMTDDVFKKNEDQYQNICNSFKAMGMNPDLLKASPGQRMASLVQHYTTYENVRYYVLFEPITKTWIRVEQLDKIFTIRKKPKWPYKSWATHDDPLNFWSKSPADDVRPVAISIEEALSSAFNEMYQKIRGKRAIDPAFFPNRAELEDFTTRFVEANVPAGKTLSQGFVEFNTPDNTKLVVNVVQFLDSFLGQKTGITPGSQGQATEDKVGIYYGNIQQVARRMGLYSTFYKQCYAELGLAHLDGAREHLKGQVSIRILGASGYESATITRNDIQFDSDPDVVITGGADEDVANREKNLKKEAAIVRALSNPALSSQYNPKWLAEQNLIIGNFDPEEVKRGMDTDSYGDQEIIAAAYEALNLMLEGEDAPRNRSANQAYLQTIRDFLDDNPEIGKEEFDRIMAHFVAHVPIALDNALRKARFIASMSTSITNTALPVGGAPSIGIGGGAPIAPGNEATNISTSGQGQPMV